MITINQESLYLQDETHQLHLRHIWSQSSRKKAPILMVHGAIENGRIFYTTAGKGLGCFLARQGYDVYVADLRGRGATIPTIQPFDGYGQTETIIYDLPMFIDFIYQRCQQPLHLIAHSWGGVLLTAMLARFPHYLPLIASQIYFGTKRRVSVKNPEALLKIRLVWQLVAPLITKKMGYLPAKKMGFGSDDETTSSHYQGMLWTKSRAWRDQLDNFNYYHACQSLQWPPTWFIAAVNDKALGHVKDVKMFMLEANYRSAKYQLLAKANGNQQDYDHINMLTHPAAVDDHFVEVAQWLEQMTEK